MRISDATHPKLCELFRNIECDNGGHLLGTVYPHLGPPLDLHNFEVPEPWAGKVEEAERGLGVLSEEEIWTFAAGEHSEVEEIAGRSSELRVANELANAFFDGWSREP